jgi:hypothetical protein
MRQRIVRQKFGAIVVDWESGSIACVPCRNSVRILILRGVSELVGESGGEAYGNIDIFNKTAMAITDQLIDQLPDWIRSSEEIQKGDRDTAGRYRIDPPTIESGGGTP